MAPAQLLVTFTLDAATGLLSALLAIALFRRGLHRLYPLFFSFCLFAVAESFSSYIPAKIQALGRIQVTYMTFGWVFYFLLVLELMDRILADHAGLARMGRRVFKVLLVLGAAISIYMLKLDSTGDSSVPDNLHLVLQVERVIASSLLLVLILFNVFLWFFPVRLSRSTKAYCRGFSCFFLVAAIGPLVLNLAGLGAMDMANEIHQGGIVLCQCLWMFAITKVGAERTPAFHRNWTVGQQQKALATLDAFEQQISGTRGS